jgi:hypothetical protein
LPPSVSNEKKVAVGRTTMCCIWTIGKFLSLKIQASFLLTFSNPTSSTLPYSK